MTLETKKKVKTPTYQKIAVDIASKIVEKQYIIGEKIYARSSIASQYRVSAETARRAISILSDLDIVETIKGSGVIIKSYEKAIDFVQQFKERQTVNNLIIEIKGNIEKQKEDANLLEENIMKLIENTARFQSLNPFIPFEVEINHTSKYLNHTISDVNFWHHTTATIIAIKRNDTIILSPGPYAVFEEGDIFYFIGNQDSYRLVIDFFYPDLYA